MTQTAKERKRDAQALIIAEFPGIIKDHIRERLSAHGDIRYDPTVYMVIVNSAVDSIQYTLYQEDGPQFNARWKFGMESELEKAWYVELSKKKEGILNVAREKIPRVCKVMINVDCEDLHYPDLTESEFEKFIRNLHIGGDLRSFQKSWEEDIRVDVTVAWDAEIQAAKADGRIPATVEDAFQIAWAYLKRTNPFEHHKWISIEGLRYALINLVMSYPPKSLKGIWWTMHPDRDDSPVLTEKEIPPNIETNLLALCDEINGRRSNP